jgi:hypothetical protein
MQVTGPSPAVLTLRRGGGAFILARVDLWAATPVVAGAPAPGWRFVASVPLDEVANPRETRSAVLPAGDYLAILTLRVEESVNGTYQFEFDAMGQALYRDSGNVDTTSSPHDARAFKDQFVLTIV